MRQKKVSKQNSGFKVLIIVGVFILTIVLAFVIGITYVANEIKGKGRKEAESIITVEKGMSPLSVGRVLEEKGIIKNARLFQFFVKYTGGAEKIQYGDFELNSEMSYEDIIFELHQTKSKRGTVRVTIPEGNTVIQFAQKLEEAGLCTAEEFIDTANNGDFSQFTFWNKIGETPNRFMKAEGYLFPETYEFYKDETVYNIVAKLYQHFDERITSEMYARMDELNMTLDEVITLASFVQEEAGHPEEQPFVAAVLHNRLKPGSALPRLECNVSSFIMEPGNYVNDYIIPYYGGKDSVPAGMLDAYNTYVLNGLPAGPISCPGEDAIKNTLYPEKDFDYLYFVTDLTGKYYYSKTYDEHLVNVAKARKVNASM